MADEISGINPIAVDRTNRDHTRRDNSNPQSRRQPPRPLPPPAAPELVTSTDDEHPVVGTRLNVRA